jgi:NADP-reducing hydrogenase subunit HndB
VTQTGCMGMCEQEPIVQIIIGDQPKVVYGKVNAEVASQIMKQHVQNGVSVKDYVLPL